MRRRSRGRSASGENGHIAGCSPLPLRKGERERTLKHNAEGGAYARPAWIPACAGMNGVWPAGVNAFIAGGGEAADNPCESRRARQAQIGEAPVQLSRIVLSLIGACLLGLVAGQPARADILISVDKTTQRMTVTVDGRLLYTWPVSTGKPGYDTPNGTFWALAKDKDHRSKEYDDAAMPYSIFFTRTGNAVHGTTSRGLGRPLSHGCVRLSVKNAAILWDLVSKQALYSTVFQIGGAIDHARDRKVASTASAPSG